MPLTSHGGDVVSRAPGKLYIAGEYAVVEPGHRAVLVAVDRFITVRITPCSPSGEYAGTISSRLYANGSRSWRRDRRTARPRQSEERTTTSSRRSESLRRW